MSQQPAESTKPAGRRTRRAPAPGGRRPLRECLTSPHLTAPRLTARDKKRLGWLGAILLALAVVIAVLIAIWDWNWFRGPLERVASARLHRQVTIAGDLNVNPWSWQPSATVDRVSVANPVWAGNTPMGSVERIAVKIRLVPLLWGDIDLRRLVIVRPDVNLVADAKGRQNWDFSDGRPKTPLNLPPIHSFVIQDGRMTYRDSQRGIGFRGTINAREDLGKAGKGFELRGEGAIRRAPFKAEVVGGPLINIERTKPYPFDVDIQAGRTHLTARGVVPKPFDFGQVNMVATARGADMAELFPLTGIALPNTPPYNLRGRLNRDGLVWRVAGLDGRVGDSDLSGSLSVDTGGVRPMLKADLQSRSLDFDDLGALFGAAPKIGAGETASPEQAAIAKKLVAQQRLFPDAPLNVERIRAMDADVTYKALSIRDTPIKLASASVRVQLDDGLLRANPVRLDLPKGRVEGFVTLNARRRVPTTELDLRLANSRIETLIPVQVDGGSPVTGPLVGRARLSGSGFSVHDAFASAAGDVMVVAPGGEIRKAFAELLGVNVIKGLGLLAEKNTSTTPIHCGIAHFQTRNGVMRADRIVFDTGPVLVKGSGTVNLGTERMDIRLRGHNKKFRVGRVLAPVTAKGPLMAPKMGVDAGGAIAQGGVALGLGALLSPLAVLLPFVDPGLAKDANCSALLAQASRQGAPVSSKSLTRGR